MTVIAPAHYGPDRRRPERAHLTGLADSRHTRRVHIPVDTAAAARLGASA
jgi:hypothetical protein